MGCLGRPFRRRFPARTSIEWPVILGVAGQRGRAEPAPALSFRHGPRPFISPLVEPSSGARIPMSQASLHPMLNIAIKAARAAGPIINQASLDVEATDRDQQKGVIDFVTEVDQAAEQAIIDTIRQPIRATASLAENRAARRAPSTATSSGSSIRWTAPPTSSTASRGTRSRSRWPSQGQGRAGGRLRPEPQRPVLRHQGRGAYLNDKRIRVSKRIRLAGSLIGTGFPASRRATTSAT